MSPHKYKQEIPTRLVPIVPVHRESIAYPLPPRRSSLPLVSPAMTGLADTIGKKEKHKTVTKDHTKGLPPLREALRTDDDVSEAHFDKWMAGYCVEPPADAGTCCLGFWVTCALYGKTHWRLRRIAAGQNPQDDAWHSKNGCNGACWAQFAASIFVVDWFGGFLIGVQRSQIRGTYGIAGNIAADIILGVCLPKCTQMHNDREVRAREGMVDLRNTKEYKAFHAKSRDHSINQQPRIQPQMSYKAQLGSLNYGNKNPQPNVTTNKQQSRTSNVHRRYTSNVKPVHQLRGSDSHNNLQQKNGVKRPRSKVLDGCYDGAHPVVLVAYVEENCQSGSMQTITKSPSNQKRASGASRLGGVLEETASMLQTAGPARVAFTGAFPSKTEHAHTPEEIHRHKSFQYFIPECDNMISSTARIVAKDSSARGHENLSYTHDFTGSPINKAILDHYEKEEKNARLAKVPGTTSNSMEIENRTVHPTEQHMESPSRKTKEHNLSDCTHIVPRSITLQHNLSDCTPVISTRGASTSERASIDNLSIVSPERGDNLPQTFSYNTPAIPKDEPIPNRHTFVDRTEVVSGRSTLRHTIFDCTSMVTTPETNTPQHGLTECDPSITPEIASALEHDLDNCRSPESLKRLGVAQKSFCIPKIIPEHGLDECEPSQSPRSSSLQQHILEDDGIASTPPKIALLHDSWDLGSPVAGPEGAVTPQQFAFGDEDVPFASPNTRKPKRVKIKNASEHTLDLCSPRASLQPTVVEEHILADCTPDPGFQSNKDAQHTLTSYSPRALSENGSDPTMNSVLSSYQVKYSLEGEKRKQVPEVREHRLVSCPTPAYQYIDIRDRQKAINYRTFDSSGSTENPQPEATTVVAMGEGELDIERSSIYVEKSVADHDKSTDRLDRKHLIKVVRPDKVSENLSHK